MAPLTRLFLLPTALLAFLSEVAANQPAPTAIKKQLPDANEKLLPEHLGFAPLPRLTPLEAAAAARLWLETQDSSDGTLRHHQPAFAPHHEESEESVLRRAAEALALLRKRSACPAGMNSCDSLGAPNKCCPEGTYCNNVSDAAVGQVACCPNGVTCGGGVGNCPGSAVSCPASLGGGCCIPGYVCQGIGCVPSASATPTTAPTTTADHATQTITSTQTTYIEGIPSTVVVTLTVTLVSSPPPTTQTTTKVVTVTPPSTDSVTGAPPWRPTITSSPQAPRTTASDSEDTQTGCPNGFYGCLATHGGGCCRTDRDCNTYSCPATPTTIISNGVTVVVPASDVPVPTVTSTCAGGWFMCGKEAGPVAGCCPSGYQCGTASCFTIQATQTEEVQKSAPSAPPKNLAPGGLRIQGVVFGGVVGTCLLSLMMI